MPIPMRLARVATLFLLATVACASPAPDSPVSSRSDASTQESVERGCGTKVGAQLPEGWRENAISVGPVSFYAAREYGDSSQASNFQANEAGLYPAIKMLVVLEGDDPVEVAVAGSSVGALSLLYDRTTSTIPADNHYELTAGDSAVRFLPCTHLRGEPTQYNGAFIVAGPGCVEIEVRVEGTEETRVRIPLGVDRCE